MRKWNKILKSGKPKEGKNKKKKRETHTHEQMEKIKALRKTVD